MSPNAEQTDNFDAEERPAAEKKPGSRLSAVSKMYDRDGKGYLDEKEQVMRDMDQSNRGFLSNDKVYKMLEEQMTMQKKMVSQRWMIIGLCVFAVVLALANMGTAFAAARLSKDTRVVQAESDGAPMLTDLNGNEIATKTTGTKVEIKSGGCVSVYEIGQLYKDVSSGSTAVLAVENETSGETSILPINGATSSDDKVCFSSAASTSPKCYSFKNGCGTSARRRLRRGSDGQTDTFNRKESFYRAISEVSEHTYADNGRHLSAVDCSRSDTAFCNGQCNGGNPHPNCPYCCLSEPYCQGTCTYPKDSGIPQQADYNCETCAAEGGTCEVSMCT